MKTFRVELLPDNIILSVPGGTNLLKAIQESGMSIESPCGGHGTCGKCTVKLVSGTVLEPSAYQLNQELKELGYILACQVHVKDDLTLEIPEFARLTKHKVLLGDEQSEEQKKVYARYPLDPLAKRLYLEIQKPGLENQISDLDRVKAHLLKQHQIEKVDITLECLRKLSDCLRQEDWQITVTLIYIEGTYHMTDVVAGHLLEPVYAVAVDVGTTTVVTTLVDLKSGTVIDSVGTYNKQAKYGSDVISRIIYCDEHPEGLAELQQAIISTINELLEELVVKNKLTKDDILLMSVAGNTIMMHLLMQMKAAYLRLEPYIPGAVQFPTFRALELGLNIGKEAPIVIVPAVSSYVGGDITAGVLATGIIESEQLTLLIDIGTNGELVLGNNEWMVTCSCSAGPAFEGSGISCGMRAMNGAIEKVTIDAETLSITYGVIGNTKPLGICGSGIICLISELKERGIIDRSGQMDLKAKSTRIRIGNEGREYVIAYADECEGQKDIAITESDIKNLLRAKAAIFAGIRTMLAKVEMDVEDIDRFYIAGGFGNSINIKEAIKLGLLSDISLDKYKYVGNTSVQGAISVLLSIEALEKVYHIGESMTYLELSVGNAFMDEFIAALFIPHTHLELFKSINNESFN